MFGAFLESFVVAELTRQATSIDEVLTSAHFRDRSGVEVDVIIERPDGSVVAIEVKSARSVNQRDASGMTSPKARLEFAPIAMDMFLTATCLTHLAPDEVISRFYQLRCRREPRGRQRTPGSSRGFLLASTQMRRWRGAAQLSRRSPRSGWPG